MLTRLHVLQKSALSRRVLRAVDRHLGLATLCTNVPLDADGALVLALVAERSVDRWFQCASYFVRVPARPRCASQHLHGPDALRRWLTGIHNIRLDVVFDRFLDGCCLGQRLDVPVDLADAHVRWETVDCAHDL